MVLSGVMFVHCVFGWVYSYALGVWDCHLQVSRFPVGFALFVACGFGCLMCYRVLLGIVCFGWGFCDLGVNWFVG